MTEVIEKRPPEPRPAEEAAVREALAALSYDELLSLLSDPRWYEPLPQFERHPKEQGMSRFVRFAMMLCCLPHTPDALRAVIARRHNPPPLPPKPSWVLLLRLRVAEFFGRRYLRQSIAQEYAAYPIKCRQFVAACSKTVSPGP